ncbi:MAG: SDR family NAD(P)-dependent oxidoreductase [Alphaproteobacteria bacterium]|jgi:NAD(P)-dependent dehydrogenase (short-subunit alcohol dehydrogenase family)|nr:SDR family NAD(P)-dependent oxidoreductase [Alphaproteobacteria bacterium]
MRGLSGKTAIITGAAQGIGRAIAERFAEEGVRLALFDIDGEQLREAATALGGETVAEVVDVLDFEGLMTAVERVAGALGGPDIMVNNAGTIAIGPVAETSEADWRRVIDVNLTGTFNGCRAVMPRMIAAGGGAILNMASWFGKRGQANAAAYCASKFGVVGLTQSLAMEIAAKGIRVNAICPGTIGETQMRAESDALCKALGLPTADDREHLIPMGRQGRPEDVARVAAFLASDDAAYMTGQAINVTGGLWLG